MERWKPTTVVAFKKSSKAKKVYVRVFREIPDKIIAKRSEKYLPKEAEIVEIGVGPKFIDKYKKKYNVKTVKQ